jgi:cyclopropane-fatty-acyl-phospholipid synthase
MSAPGGRRLTRLIGARLRGLGIPVRLRFPGDSTLALGPAPKVELTFRTRRAVGKLLRGDIDGLGEAYVRGDLAVEGRIEDVIEIGIALAERLGRRLAWLAPALRLLPRPRHTRSTDGAWIRHHYDVSNDFYALWLDRRMIYSCAYFERGDEDIDRAQEQKLEHICRKLRLVPGERLLDIGCGWGGLLEFAATRHGVSGVGITLSPAQHELAQRRIATSGLAARVEIRLQDYRDLPAAESYDKVVSVGMYEHVGHANLPLYCAVLRRAVKPQGLVLNHGITTADPEGGSRGPGGDFIDRFVFPGGALPHLSRVVQEMARQGFDILDVESLRPHYAATLTRWVRRLEARRSEAIAAAGEERYRIWRVYMAGCAIAFARHWLSVYQVLAGKPAADGTLARPWTRRHQYLAGAPALASGLPDWRPADTLSRCAEPGATRDVLS